MTRASILAAIAILIAACGPPPPARPRPTDIVRTEIDRAEQAERARRHDIARVHYERAVAAAKDPTSIAFARHEFAETLITWGEYAEAIRHLEAVLAIRPKDAAVWHDLGMLEHHEHDDAGAIAALEKARDLAPRDPRPRIALAALRWKLGDKAGARSEYEHLLTLDLPDRIRAKVVWALGVLAKR